MIVAIVRNKKVINRIICESLEIAQQLFPDSDCVPGDNLNIGDSYPNRDIPETPISSPDEERDTLLIDLTYRLTLLELGVSV
jgi:hypothetical protein